MDIIHLTKKEFLEKVDNFEADPENWKYLGDKPCVIDFYATWCGPCKALGPILEEVAKEYADKVYFYKIDVDKEEELSSIFGIKSVPTLLYVPMTGNPSMGQGVVPKPELIKIIGEKLLK